MNSTQNVIFAVCLSTVLSTPGFAQEETANPVAAAEAPDDSNAEAAKEDEPSIWQLEGTAKVGERALLDIPEGYRFTASEGTQEVLRVMGNIPSGNELGLVGPGQLEKWFVIYTFQGIGYVKDDEKDDLDADGMLKTFQANTQTQNEERKKMGLATVEILGWAMPPSYNSDSNILEWATKARFTDAKGETSDVVNYRTRVLGRKGVMAVTLVCGPEELEESIAEYQTMMKGFKFADGESYAEYKPGDRIAEYGLTALVLGGATVAAAKLGFFAAALAFFKKGFKFIIVGIGAALIGLKNLVFGRGKQN